MTNKVWPEEAPYAVCPTHDVDRIHKYAYHYLAYSLTKGTDGFLKQLLTLRERFSGKDPFWNFELLMETEIQLGVRSTFLFLNESAAGFGPKFWGRYDINDKRIRRIIKTLTDGGWEIGLHGSYYSYDKFPLLKNEKETLEDITGKAVVSTRQHHLKFSPGLTWEIHQTLGLEVDSTIGYADKVWDFAAGVFPYYPEGYSILELPITVMDTVGVDIASVQADVSATIDKIKAAGGLIVLDWHQCAYNRHENPARIEMYTAILQQAKKDRAWIATMAKIAKFWRSRGENVDQSRGIQP